MLHTQAEKEGRVCYELPERVGGEIDNESKETKRRKRTCEQ